MKRPKLSPCALEKYILLLAKNPQNGLQYAILQGQTKFNSVAAIYQAAIECLCLAWRNLRLGERTQARHYGKLSHCFFNMFDLLTSNMLE